eukprot:scaffold74809_cov40-Prasinocladus_malaysianus.AAC.1
MTHSDGFRQRLDNTPHCWVHETVCTGSMIPWAICYVQAAYYTVLRSKKGSGMSNTYVVIQ